MQGEVYWGLLGEQAPSVEMLKAQEKPGAAAAILLEDGSELHSQWSWRPHQATPEDHIASYVYLSLQIPFLN